MRRKLRPPQRNRLLYSCTEIRRERCVLNDRDRCDWRLGAPRREELFEYRDEVSPSVDRPALQRRAPRRDRPGCRSHPAGARHHAHPAPDYAGELRRLRGQRLTSACAWKANDHGAMPRRRSAGRRRLRRFSRRIRRLSASEISAPRTRPICEAKLRPLASLP